MIKIKFFFDPINQIQPWLNRITSSGYRLSSVNNFIYSFEQTDQRYSYTTQFIGANPSGENLAYISMLEDKGFRTFRSPLNQGNIIAFGKIRIRPFGKNLGKIATSFGNYNKEILIVESKEGFTADLLTGNLDIPEYYSNIRNTYAHGSIIWIVLTGFVTYTMYEKGFIAILMFPLIILLTLSLLHFRLALVANRNYKKYKQGVE